MQVYHYGFYDITEALSFTMSSFSGGLNLQYVITTAHFQITDEKGYALMLSSIPANCQCMLIFSRLCLFDSILALPLKCV